MSDESDKLARLRKAAGRLKRGAAKGDERCSFCGKGKPQVKHLISGRSVCICDQCIAECSRLLESERA